MQNTDLTIYIQEASHSPSWWQRNKKSVMIAGGIILGAIGTYVLFTQHDRISSFFTDRVGKLVNHIGNVSQPYSGPELPPSIMIEEASAQNIPIYAQTITVGEHIRNLPCGRTPSVEKITTALEHNFILGEHQTWVESYTKNRTNP